MAAFTDGVLLVGSYLGHGSIDMPCHYDQPRQDNYCCYTWAKLCAALVNAYWFTTLQRLGRVWPESLALPSPPGMSNFTLYHYLIFEATRCVGQGLVWLVIVVIAELPTTVRTLILSHRPLY